MVSPLARNLGTEALVTLMLVGAFALGLLGMYARTGTGVVADAVRGFFGTSFVPSASTLALTAGLFLGMVAILFVLRAFAP